MSRMGFRITQTMASLNIISYNSTGLGGTKVKLINDLLTDCAPQVLMLQETWLLPNDTQRLLSIHPDYLGSGISSVSNDEVPRGRPYGGLGFLWNKSIAANVRAIKTSSDRVYALRIKLQDYTALLINVYFPVDRKNVTEVSPPFEECLQTIESLISDEKCDFFIT